MYKKIKMNLKEVYRGIQNIITILKLIFQSSKFTALMMLLVTILRGAIVPIDMMISKYFIDSVVSAITIKGTSLAIRSVMVWVTIQFSLAVLSQLFNGIGRYLQENLRKSYDIYISQLLIGKMNELDMSFFESAKFNDKLEKANKESGMRSLNILSTLIEIIQTFVSLLGAIVIIISLNPLIVIICICTVIPMFIVNMKIYDKIYGVYNERFQETRFANSVQRLLSTYNSVKEIRLNRLGEYFKNIIISIKKKHLEQDKVIGKKQMKNLFIVDLCNNIVSFGFKIYVVIVTIIEGLSIGTMTMYISAFANVEVSIKGIINAISYLYEDNLYLESLFEILKMQSKIKIDSKQESFDGKINNCIEFRNVSFKYPESNKYVLKNISFELKANKTYALVGLNGSGKTTLVKLLARLYDPDEGEIYIDGKNIKEFNVETLHKYIGIVFQDFIHYPFTVKENIGFGSIDELDDNEKIRSAAIKAGADKFIEKLPNGYETKLEKLWDNGVDLSLGQWQKIAISRAFNNNSSLLILDEPTASLDAQAEYELFQNFKALINDTTCIMISHRFSTVRMADKIIVLENGSIAEFGNHDELIKNDGIYSKFFNMQAEAYIS